MLIWWVFLNELAPFALCRFKGSVMCMWFSFFSPAQRDDINLSPGPVCQDTGFLSVDAGDNMTLPCFYGRSATVISWYKQSIGKKLQLMSTFYLYGQEAFFIGEFRNSTRFQLATENLQHRLTILDIRNSDSATYYCMGSNFFQYEFHDGTTVSVKGSGLNIPVSIPLWPSGTIHSENSVMLNCTVHTGICDDEHGFCAFRKSEESQSGLIYAAGGRNTKNNNKTCLNLFALKDGTDHCAVAACGHVLFGDGTRLEFEGELHSS